MTTLFANLKARPLPIKATLMLGYGVLSFLLIWVVGEVVADNFLLFRISEFLWFVHIVIIANQLSYASSDLISLAVLGLSPGLINNLLLILNVR